MKKGFTIIEVITTLAVVGVLATISVPNMMAYVLKTEYTAHEAVLNFLMRAQEIYYLEEDEFFPQQGTINIPKGVKMNKLPALDLKPCKGGADPVWCAKQLDKVKAEQGLCYSIVMPTLSLRAVGCFYSGPSVSAGRMSAP